ncbi:hypothetical protein ACFY0A_39710 [Streptomyces sp. NPDC001698]|uniref:hypothetical protein n=1 Tax=Streptomyces sp. NPDC001698 TaxID=3364601 RepID=UPI0036CF0FBE
MTDTTATCTVVYDDGIRCARKRRYSDWCQPCYQWSRAHGGASPMGRRRRRRKQCAAFERGVRCPEFVKSHGWCTKHLYRVERFGNPLRTSTRANGDLLADLQAAAQATTDECIRLYAREGRPTVPFQGKHVNAARAVWILANGDPGEVDVLHRCNGGSGAEGCINIRHLYLGDDEQNVADRQASGRTARGERGGAAILTEEQVRTILSTYVKRAPRWHPGSTAALADRFGVAPTTIGSITRRENWKHLG